MASPALVFGNVEVVVLTIRVGSVVKASCVTRHLRVADGRNLQLGGRMGIDTGHGAVTVAVAIGLAFRNAGHATHQLEGAVVLQQAVMFGQR